MSYILKNITGRDINLGDLRIKIPSGKCRDLLARKSRVTFEEIMESEEKGSISKFLGKGLLKVCKVQEIGPPLMEMADPSAVSFPQRKKSSIVIEVSDVDDEIRNLMLNEDEEYLKQLEIESDIASGESLPIVAKEEE